MARSSGSYPTEMRERAVRLVAEVRTEHTSEWAAMESVDGKLGIGSTQTIHNWVRRAEIDAALGRRRRVWNLRSCGSFERKIGSCVGRTRS